MQFTPGLFLLGTSDEQNGKLLSSIIINGSLWSVGDNFEEEEFKETDYLLDILLKSLRLYLVQGKEYRTTKNVKYLWVNETTVLKHLFKIFGRFLLEMIILKMIIDNKEYKKSWEKEMKVQKLRKSPIHNIYWYNNQKKVHIKMLEL